VRPAKPVNASEEKTWSYLVIGAARIGTVRRTVTKLLFEGRQGGTCDDAK
jgi:hypothetical protein